MSNPNLDPDLNQPDLNVGASEFKDVMQADVAESDHALDFGDVDNLATSTLSQGVPSRPLFGRLPLARLIPQDVHSVMDYVDAATVMAGALSRSRRAKMMSLLLGSSGALVSALTDYRLSVAKVIPIEAHEVIDH